MCIRDRRNDHYLEIGLPRDDEARIPPAQLGYGAGGTAAQALSLIHICHGMASKLFWDFCEDKTVEAVDPKNVLVFATTPFSGAVVPAASARCEFTGISPFSLPEWYNRSSMGGRLAGMMKEAGYDACVVRGKADAPVWINVVNDRVEFNDAADLWGLDAFECQERIWDEAVSYTHLAKSWSGVTPKTRRT